MFKTVCYPCLRTILAVFVTFAGISIGSSQEKPASLGSAAPQFDGPAELPRVYVNSSFANTHAPGKTRQVRAGDDLQKILKEVQCGHTLQLQAGATFTGQFTLPAKSCDDSHWIVIRTSAPDSALPPEGT